MLIPPSQGSSENVKGQPRPGTPAGQGWGDSVVKRRLSDKINCGAASDQSDLIMNWWHAVAFPKFNCELRLCKRCFPCLSSSRPCLGAKVSKAALCSFSLKRHRNFQPLPGPDGCCSPRERRLPGDPLGTPSPLCIPRFLLVATQVPPTLSTSPELPLPGPLLAAARARAEGFLPGPRE